MDLNNENKIDPPPNQDAVLNQQPASEPYVKPYISVKKHGENGRLFDDLFHDDRYKRNKGRNYH